MFRSNFLIFIILLFLPGQSLAQDVKGWQLFALGGVFAPTDDEIQNIYGNGLSGKIAITAGLGSRGRLKLSLSRLTRTGDPFYRSDDFDAGNAADLTLTDVTLLVETDFLTINYPKLYLGMGIDYVFAEENITAQPNSEGSNIAGTLSISPEVRLTGRLLLVAEVSYRFLDVTFKSGRNRYQLNLSGTGLMLGLGWNFGQY